MAELRRLEINIVVNEEEAIKDLKAVQKEGDKTSKSLEDTGKGAEKSSLGFGKLTASVAAGIAVFKVAEKSLNAIVNVVKGFVVEGIKFSGVVNQQLAVLNQLAKQSGTTAEELNEYINILREQGITLAGSIEILTRAKQANIDFADAVELAKLAQDAAAVSGLNSTETAKTLAEAVATGNTEMLKQFGIFVDLNDAYKEYAEENDLVANNLDSTQKRQALLNKTLEEGEEIQNAYVASLNSWNKVLKSTERPIEDIKLGLGLLFNDGLLKVTKQTFVLAKAISSNLVTSVVEGDKTVLKLNEKFQFLQDVISELVQSAFRALLSVGIRVVAFFVTFGEDILKTILVIKDLGVAVFGVMGSIFDIFKTVFGFIFGLFNQATGESFTFSQKLRIAFKFIELALVGLQQTLGFFGQGIKLIGEGVKAFLNFVVDFVEGKANDAIDIVNLMVKGINKALPEKFEVSEIDPINLPKFQSDVGGVLSGFGDIANEAAAKSAEISADILAIGQETTDSNKKSFSENVAFLEAEAEKILDGISNVSSRALKTIEDTTDDTEDDLDKLGKKLEDLSFKEAERVFNESIDTLKKIAEVRAEIEQTTFENIEESTDKQEELLEVLGNTELELDDLLSVWQDGYKAVETAIDDLAKEHEKKMQDIQNDIDETTQKLNELQSAFEQESQDALADFTRSAADIVVEAERALADLQAELKSERGEEDPSEERIRKLQEEIKKQEAILKTQADQQLATQEELTRARELADANDLERLQLLFEEQEALRLAEFEAERAQLEQRLIELEELKQAEIDLNQEKKEALESLEALITQTLLTNLATREAAETAMIDRLIQKYNELAAAKARAGFSGGGATSPDVGALLGQFASGGFTGGGALDKVAGLVHKGEWVAPNWLVKSMSPVISQLEGIRKRGFADGGYTSPTNNYNQPVTINVKNKGGANWNSIAKRLSWELRRS